MEECTYVGSSVPFPSPGPATTLACTWTRRCADHTTNTPARAIMPACHLYQPTNVDAYPRRHVPARDPCL